LFEGNIDEFIKLTQLKNPQQDTQEPKENKQKTNFGYLKTNSAVSNSIVQNWTKSALDCYKINCFCDVCPIKNAGYSFKCKMKHVVNVLLETKGLPNEAEIYNPNEEQEVA